MATKTISLRLDAYERLCRARRSPDESFTQVVLRAEWPEVSLTARELRSVYASEGPFFEDDELDQIAEAEAEDHPPADKWAEAPEE
jgi:predicted CopG family antitoxin